MMKNYRTFLYIELFRARYLSKTSFLLLKTCQDPIIRNAQLSYCAYVPRRSFAEQAIFRLVPVRLIGSFQPLVCCVCQDLTGQVMKQQTKDRKPRKRKKKKRKKAAKVSKRCKPIVILSTENLRKLKQIETCIFLPCLKGPMSGMSGQAAVSPYLYVSHGSADSSPPVEL